VGWGYASLVYETYTMVKSKMGSADHWQRFFNGGSINMIQCAEQLEGPRYTLRKTYSSCTWQNETLDAVKKVARGECDWLTSSGSGSASGLSDRGRGQRRKGVLIVPREDVVGGARTSFAVPGNCGRSGPYRKVKYV